MCIAVPAEVMSIDGPTTLVEVYGERFAVTLMMTSEAVQPGDAVALRARRNVVAGIAPAHAEAAKRLFEDIFLELAARARNARVA